MIRYPAYNARARARAGDNYQKSSYLARGENSSSRELYLLESFEDIFIEG